MNFGRNSYGGGDRVIVQRRIAENKLAALQTAVQKNYRLGGIAKWEQSSSKLMSNKQNEREQKELAKQKKLDLEIRRSKLRQLLNADALRYKQEIDSKLETPQQRRERLERKAKELRARRIARREEFVAAQRLKQFRDQCDELRLNNGHNLTMECDRIRKQQMKEKELAKQYEQGLHVKHLSVWQQELQKKTDRERREAEYKQRLNADTAAQIKAQMAEMENERQREKLRKAQEVKQRVASLKAAKEEAQLKARLKDQEKVANRADIRSEYEAFQQQKRDEELAEKRLDREFVQRVLSEEKADDAAKAEKHLGDREDIQAYLKYLEALKLKEKAHEQHLDALRQKELEAAWSKRESKWKREELARQQLLMNVVDGRRDQIAYKEALKGKGSKQNAVDTQKLEAQLAKFSLEEKGKTEHKMKYNREIQDFLRAQMKEKEEAEKRGHEEFLAFDVDADKNSKEYARLLKQEMAKDSTQLEQGKSTHNYPKSTANWWTY